VSVADKKTMYIAVAALVIIIVIAGVVVYVFLYGGGGGGGGGGEEETIYTLGNATSLQYDVDLTTAGVLGTYKFAGKNLDTGDMLLRVDANPVVSEGTTYSYVMYATNQTSYTNATGTWAEGDFTTDWTTYSTMFEGYIAHDEDWTTGDGDITYTDDAGNGVKVYNIVINPTLADSVFQSM
jgi:hypothetical protein